MEAIKLSNHPDIIDLCKILEQHGLNEQKKEVQYFAGYITGLEEKLEIMLSEIKSMRTEINNLHDNKIRIKSSGVLDRLEEKFSQTKAIVVMTKNRLIESAGKAVKTFQDKGKTALAGVLEAMRIPAAIAHLKNGCVYNAQQINIMRTELHEVSSHLKNTGHVLIGKPVKQAEALEADKGILAKFRNFLESCGAVFSDMERNADALIADRQKKVAQVSVKSELRRLKQNYSAKTNIAKEKMR